MSHQVVIAGAGPVGLFLASELALAGADVIVLEQADHLESPLKRLPFGMRGLSVPTLEALHRRDLLDAVIAAQPTNAPPAHWMQQAGRAAGHFAGIQFYHDQIDTSAWPYRLPSKAGTSLAAELQSLETVLAARAAALGVETRRGVTVERFDATDGDVTVHTTAGTFHGEWLVGCDGGRSAVRRAGAFEIDGTDPEFTGYSVMADLADPEKLTVGRSYTPTGMYTFAHPGTIAMVDFDGGNYHRTTPITLDHVQSVLRGVSCTDVTIENLTLATTWTDRAFATTTYRKGRVLLAGDAAHIHSPLGGQGLNLGLGDAMNLGWKLGAVIRNTAPAAFLDTYRDERRPIAERVLDWSRAQVALMRPTRSTRALGAIMRDLINTRDGATYFAERVSAVSLRHDLSDRSDLAGPHPLVGRSAPDFAFKDGTTLGQYLRTGNGLSISFDGTQPPPPPATWRDRITTITTPAENDLNLSTLLIRPDGIVASATNRNEQLSRTAQTTSR